MRTALFVFAAAALLTGCMHWGGGMNQRSMSREEMMRHCQMMDEHGDHDPVHHDPARHGGMSHEEMQRQCDAMRAADQGAPHQHPH